MAGVTAAPRWTWSSVSGVRGSSRCRAWASAECTQPRASGGVGPMLESAAPWSSSATSSTGSTTTRRPLGAPSSRIGLVGLVGLYLLWLVIGYLRVSQVGIAERRSADTLLALPRSTEGALAPRAGCRTAPVDGLQYPAGARFCTHCERDLSLDCANCGATIRAADESCYRCGTRTGAADPLPPADRLRPVGPTTGSTDDDDRPHPHHPRAGRPACHSGSRAGRHPGRPRPWVRGRHCHGRRPVVGPDPARAGGLRSEVVRQQAEAGITVQ